ncbi:hypothetical protein PSACC_03528 [Paramicrosporidium saccamoebae]|uniref:Cysteine protease n=1 Tax=Paramicrosporidium saccamoebae TaxID=1246581 RepID=A0A2H9TG40_9FUNG|nr:hypothetical protein PSACC_03528 [Paramicrosporidium saccamoebae]
MGRRIGEWHAPSVTSRCLSGLINENLNVGLRSYCAVDMTIDLEKIGELLGGAKVLVWIPMRLGVDSLNDVYIGPIKALLGTVTLTSLTVRGRPNSALYFVGFENNDLLYLDPHYPRPAPRENVSCADLGRVAFYSIDPCLVAGFVISDADILAKWTEEIVQIKTAYGDQLFSIKAPASEMEHATVVEIDSDMVEIDFEPI